MTIAPNNVNYGEREIALANEILRTQVGSGLHGIAIPGTDDRDEMGIYIEPKRFVYGVADRLQEHVWRSRAEGERSGPGDTDLTIYTLRQYVRLALKGHPTILLPMFAPTQEIVTSTYLGHELRAHRHLFLSHDTVARFLGYMRQQHERMLGGGKRNAVPNRPELIEKYGWDVKYGAHALRLALQGYEVAMHGTLTLPMRTDDRELVLSVKRGEMPQQHVSEVISLTERYIEEIMAADLCPLPRTPHYVAIDRWMVGAHEQHWELTEDDR